MLSYVTFLELGVCEASLMAGGAVCFRLHPVQLLHVRRAVDVKLIRTDDMAHIGLHCRKGGGNIHFLCLTF